jgi:cytochrome c553
MTSSWLRIAGICLSPVLVWANPAEVNPPLPVRNDTTGGPDSIAQAAPLDRLTVPAPIGSAAGLPGWAYPVNPPGDPPVRDRATVLHVPDSPVAFTRGQLALHAGTAVPDWHPGEHPAMPDIVAKGRDPQVFACGYCHLPSGAGRPENTSLAGLTPAYLKQQMLAFRNGERPGSEPKRGPQTAMITLAKAATEAEIDEAAAYFAAVKPAAFIKVVEAAVVPKTIIAGWTLMTAPAGGTEPMGNRIVEMPEDFERFELRDSHTPYVAYVPVGSLQRGADLVTTGAGGRTVQCTTCHGPELHGLADVPRLAGRSPSYLMRQLYDFKNGRRTGGTTVLMKPVVAGLTDADMVAIVAYLASREP